MNAPLQTREPRIRLAANAGERHRVTIDKKHVILVAGETRHEQRADRSSLKNGQRAKADRSGKQMHWHAFKQRPLHCGTRVCG